MQVGYLPVKRIGTRLFTAVSSDLDKEIARRMVDEKVSAKIYARYYPYRSKRDGSVRYVVYESEPSRISSSFCETDLMLRR
jgi:hypothetical protein